MKKICILFIACTLFVPAMLISQDRGLTLLVKDLGTNARAGRQYLLLIAIDKYQSWTPLRNPVKDAREIRDVLTSRYYIDETIELFDAQATKANILKTFTALQAKLQTNDSLLVYYAGHGHLDAATNSGFWIPVNAGTDKFEQANWLPNTQIRGLISNMKSIHLLMVSDSCFSGDLLNSSRGLQDEINIDYFRKAYTRISRQILTSGASETVPDESEFSRMFKLALQKNNNPYFDPLMLFNDIRLGVRNTMPMFGNLKDTGHQDGASFLLFLKEEKPKEIAAIEEPKKVEPKKAEPSPPPEKKPMATTQPTAATTKRMALEKPFIFLTESEGHAYYFYGTKVPLSRAKQLCEKNGGHLVTISGPRENDVIVQALGKLNSSLDMWLGYSRARTVGWSWVTGEKSDFTNWDAGQPDNTGGSEEYAMISGSSFRWHDLPDTDPICFLMEVEPASTRENSNTAAVPNANGPGSLVFEDGFDGPALNFRWSWVRESPERWNLKQKPGYLALTAVNGNLYQGTNNSRNILLTPVAAADFTLETKIDFAPYDNFQQAGLIVYRDDDNYVRLNRIYADQKKIEIIYEVKGDYKYLNIPNTLSPVCLRLKKIGDVYTASFSGDGNTYTDLPPVTAALGGPLKAGLACDNVESTYALTGYFDFIRCYAPGAAASVSPAGGFRDDFTESSLDGRWSWVRETQANWSLKESPGSLTLKVLPGDLAEKMNNGRNLLLVRIAATDFQIETKLDFAPAGNYEQAGLIIYQDDDNYFKFVHQFDPKKKNTAVAAEEKNGVFSGVCAATALKTSWLRLVKTGNKIGVYLSLNGRDFVLIGERRHEFTGQLQAGLVAFNGAAKSAVASFDYCYITSAGK
jgi:regulation of enolase protein 1 (concanavalin A-like superfamily)